LGDELIKAIKSLTTEQLENSIKENKEMITKFSKKQLSHMESVGASYRRNQQNFAYILGFKSVMFWIFSGSWLIWALIHIYQLIMAFI
jgi:hypothetical protein